MQHIFKHAELRNKVDKHVLRTICVPMVNTAIAVFHIFSDFKRIERALSTKTPLASHEHFQ